MSWVISENKVWIVTDGKKEIVAVFMNELSALRYLDENPTTYLYCKSYPIRVYYPDRY